MKSAPASGIAQELDDWRARLDFADWPLPGKAPARRFDINPFAAE